MAALPSDMDSLRDQKDCCKGGVGPLKGCNDNNRMERRLFSVKVCKSFGASGILVARIGKAIPGVHPTPKALELPQA